MLSVGSAFINPAPQHFLLFGGQFPMRINWRHYLRLVVTDDPLPGGARGGVADDDGGVPAAVGRGGIRDVESQLSFARRLVEPMASEAILRQDWSHVPVVVDLRLSRRWGGQQGDEQERNQPGQPPMKSAVAPNKRNWHSSTIINAACLERPSRRRENVLMFRYAMSSIDRTGFHHISRQMVEPMI